VRPSQLEPTNWKTVSSESGSSALRSHRHVVQFYDRDEDLAESTGDYLADAIAEGGAAVIVATPGRCAGFEARLAVRGLDVAAARRDGTLVFLDATRLAQWLTRAGRVDRAGFDALIRPAILAASEAPGPVRVYGEVVALLWEAGHVDAALELEGFWNELGRETPFSLYCGYPRQSVEGSQYHVAISEVCRLHTAVVGRPVTGGGPVTGGLVGGALVGGPAPSARSAGRPVAAEPAARVHWTDAARTFGSTRDDPRMARRFVLEMLAPWQDDQLPRDAALVVTELATNAVLHAGSAFSVSLILAGDVIRISVSDTVPLGQPGGNRWLPAAPGHGLGVVAAMAARWGVETLASGKAIWAELPLSG
jgi:MEDS: MEthanogen/methylotroph, DcmR Sensory domain